MKITFLEIWDSKADGSFWSPLLAMSTVQAVVPSSNDSNVPTDLVLQHDLDCPHLCIPKTSSLPQWLFNT